MKRPDGLRCPGPAAPRQLFHRTEKRETSSRARRARQTLWAEPRPAAASWRRCWRCWRATRRRRRAPARPSGRLTSTWPTRWWPRSSTSCGRRGRSWTSGSGAGLPGAVLAVALPGCEVRLLESQRRKCAFLEGLLGAAGLANAEVVCARAEQWPEGREQHDAATARALGPQAVVLEYAAPLLRVGGVLVDWRGRRDARARSGRRCGRGSCWGSSGGGCVAVTPYPGAPDLHLHVWAKRQPTPSAFRAARGSPGSDRSAPERSSARAVRARTRRGREPRGRQNGASVAAGGNGLRDCQPKGRSGQDDDRGQRGGLHRRGRLRDAAGGRRPAGQRDRRAGHRHGHTRRGCTRC